MRQAWLKTLRWHVSRAGLSNAWLPLLGLLACSLMAWKAWGLRQEVAQQQALNVYREAAHRYSQTAAEQAPLQARFLAYFPAAGDDEAFIRRSYQSANTLGLRITHASQEVVATPLPGLNKRLIRMSLRAPDEHYRTFIYQQLQQAPQAALQRLHIGRQDDGAYVLDLTWEEYAR